jgi:hypothetical protein
MRIFAIAIAATLVLAAATPLILNLIQKTSAQAYSTSAARLDQQESVNNYGRAG